MNKLKIKSIWTESNIHLKLLRGIKIISIWPFNRKKLAIMTSQYYIGWISDKMLAKKLCRFLKLYHPCLESKNLPPASQALKDS